MATVRWRAAVADRRSVYLEIEVASAMKYNEIHAGAMGKRYWGLLGGTGTGVDCRFDAWRAFDRRERAKQLWARGGLTECEKKQSADFKSVNHFTSSSISPTKIQTAPPYSPAPRPVGPLERRSKTSVS